MRTWTRELISLLAACAILASPAAAEIVVPQDSKSKELLALPPGEADGVRRRDLLADLQPGGVFLSDPNGNVYGMTYVTWPYLSEDSFVCREDLVTLTYAHGDFSGEYRQIETQARFFVDGDPTLTGRYGHWQGCDRHHPGPKANWILAPTAFDADIADRTFHEAEIEVAAGKVQPAACERTGPDACRQWIISLNDRLDAVDTCMPIVATDVCYVISIGDDRLTIDATMSANGLKPSAINSIKVEEVVTVGE